VGKALLEVRGGEPPPEEPDVDHAAQPTPEAPPVVAPGLVEPPAEWSREAVETFVALPFMAAHLFARRRGPADAWMPDDAELDLMAGPLLNMANRYSWLARFARFGDPLAFASAAGTYTVAESRRIARWRLENEGVPAAPDEEIGFAGLHVAAERPGGQSPPPVRPWRPPVVPEEA
jgi:hypothetical protein